MRLISTRRTSLVSPWEASLAFTLRFVTPSGRYRWLRPGLVTARRKSTKATSRASRRRLRRISKNAARKNLLRSMLKALRVCSSRKRTRAAGACSPTAWRSTIRKAPPTPCGAYRCKGLLYTISTPGLVMVGDEDDHCLQPGLFLKHTISRSGLAVFPKTGHTLNLEEPELFNRHVAEFIAQVEAGRWGPRDPRADPAQVMRTD